MTREEAIKHINGVRLFLLALNKPIDEYMVALDMAISALERDMPKQPDTCPIYDGVCGYPIEFCSECPRHTKQEPCDAISREAVIEYLSINSDNILDYQYAVDGINELPSVQPSRKVIEDIKAEIEGLQCDSFEVADFSGNRYTYEYLYKADVMAIIDKYISGKEKE